jgi:hypothetical protein
MLLTNYIRAAMRRATYEILPDGTYYGEIPGFQGVYANEQTLEDVVRLSRRFWRAGSFWVYDLDIRCLWWTASL